MLWQQCLSGPCKRMVCAGLHPGCLVGLCLILIHVLTFMCMFPGLAGHRRSLACRLHFWATVSCHVVLLE
jgi:hypothetical protein